VLADWNETTRRAVAQIVQPAVPALAALGRHVEAMAVVGNLDHRAERLGAHLSIDSGPTGTRVRLEIPQRVVARA
jgi:signal transduction histidine kinase